jgi:hypothetical protein
VRVIHSNICSDAAALLEFCHRNGLFLSVTKADFGTGLLDEQRIGLMRAMWDNPKVKEIWSLHAKYFISDSFAW